MKLYYSPTSPYVRKVMIVLHETGQLGDVELVDAMTSPMAPADVLAGHIPLKKVPALERVDGPVLFDSRVICAYLDARADGGLYPKGDAVWQTRTLEALADGILDAALLMTYEGRLRPEAHRWDAWTEAQWDKVAGACDALERVWASHLAGPLDMGQIAVACALGYVDFRHDARGWRNGRESLAAWYEAFSARESFAATTPKDP